MVALTFAALIISVVSLGLSSALAFRQYREAQVANQLPIILNLFHGLRDDDFHRSEDYVQRDLANECSVTLGLSNLPPNAKLAFQRVASLYASIGGMINFGLLDEDLASALFGSRMLRSWEVMSPYISAERHIRGGVYGEYFEDFAARVKRRPPVAVMKDQRLSKLL